MPTLYISYFITVPVAIYNVPRTALVQSDLFVIDIIIEVDRQFEILDWSYYLSRFCTK